MPETPIFLLQKHMKDIMQTIIQETLTLQDIMRIFHVSQPSVYRWVSEARAGKSQFPIPLSGYKRKLLWSKDAILAFQNRNHVPSQLESAKARSQRHAVAMQSLAARGVKVN